MLAGHMRSSFLRDALEVPTVLLPLRRSATVLEAWLEILDEAFVSEVCIALNLGSDTHIIDTAIRSITRKRAFRSVVKTVLEPAAWRGPGGVIRDLTLDLEPDTIIVVVEGNSAPVSSARDVISAVQGGADGAVGVCDSNSPAGISAFRRAIFEQVPKIGYFDLKEQLLPALHDSSFQVRPVSVLRGSSRIHDRVSYLEAIGRELSVENQVVTYSKEQAQTVIAETAVIDGKCLIESGVSVGDEAVVHDSVILQGATINKGAVVARSVVGQGVTIQAGSRVVNTIIGKRGMAPKSSRTELRRTKVNARSQLKPNSGATQL